MSLTDLRNSIRERSLADEHGVVTDVISKPALSKEQRKMALKQAKAWVEASRKDKSNQNLLDSFLLEFGLSNKEGLALMCLAESLLRIPDNTSADRLIAEKITSGDWGTHFGNSDSLFVNASSLSLHLAGKIVHLDRGICENPKNWLQSLTTRLGEPIVRRAFRQAMRQMGKHYVLGRTIQEGMARKYQGNSEPLYSFDMLGEAARTEADAKQYFDAYAHAIDSIGSRQTNPIQQSIYHTNGISVKLSALYPRYEYSKHHLLMTQLLERIKTLCHKAFQYNINLSIDAEEAARLDISLDIFEALARDPKLKNWQGLGFVLQAYQKRSILVADWLIELAKITNKRIIVRLVKGAYWDYEIKHAQEHGLKDYPVFTRKVHTDASYLACAKKLLEHKAYIFSQFATHNAYTVASISQLATALNSGTDFEFQRLHGMGELLYKHIQEHKVTHGIALSDIALRVYAPIGKHQDLLPYLVRRLLENGANSSFVNRFLDTRSPIDELIKDHYEDIQQASHHRHSNIPLPRDLYLHQGELRINAAGIDLDSKLETETLISEIKNNLNYEMHAHCIINGQASGLQKTPVFNPTNSSSPLSYALQASEKNIESAINFASSATEWKTTPIKVRAKILRKMASLLEENRSELIGLIVIEAGRTIADAVSEVREAVDFCSYYALQAESLLENTHDINACGVFLCISPWNFPLAIFIGQISAALVTGNSVIAKPAEQTPIIATRVSYLFHQAGIPPSSLQLLLGDGKKIASALLEDHRLSGVCFTGSNAVAGSINQQLAKRPKSPIPFIAETGGQNCLIADSSALPEQLVDDIITSAFHSAGQRCSALRVLFIQQEIADKTLDMLKGAMQSLTIGDPMNLSTDIGPVIDQPARENLERHTQKMDKMCKKRFVLSLDEAHSRGTFFSPRFYEIDALDQIEHEVFGPILHVIKFNSNDLDNVIQQINATGYGLTLGIHSRIEAFADHIIRHTRIGNNYINRNMVGAIVGVNPFGGMGLSGTGPKAGGPNYLHKFCSPKYKQAPLAITQTDNNPNTKIVSTSTQSTTINYSEKAFVQLRHIAPERYFRILYNILEDKNLWKNFEIDPSILKTFICHRRYQAIALPGPTGEENHLIQSGRGLVYCLISDQSIENILKLAFLVLGSGSSLILFCDNTSIENINNLKEIFEHHGLPKHVIQTLPKSAISRCVASLRCDALFVQQGEQTKIKETLAKRKGALVSITEIPTDLSILSEEAIDILRTNLIVEKTRTENLVARGGNTSLFCIEDDIGH